MGADSEPVRLRRGDPDAFDALLARYQNRLYRYLVRLTVDPAAAEDLFQETWLKVLTRIHRYDERRPFEPWLFAVARNLAIDHLRKASPESLDEPSEDGKPHEFVFVPDVGPVVVKVIDAPGAWGHVWHLAGAGVTTQQEMVDEIGRQAGRPIKIRAAGKWMLRIIGLFKPLMREMVEMHYLLTEPLIMDDSALQNLIGPVGKTSYAEGIRQSLAAARQMSDGARSHGRS